MADEPSSTASAPGRPPGPSASPANGDSDPTESAISLTAFATGTGFAFQVVGTALIMAACALWAISGPMSWPDAEPVNRWIDYLTGTTSPAAAVTVGLLTSFVGGAGLLAAGVGLQHERRSSGPFALLVTGTMSLAYWFVFGRLIASEGGWLLITLAGIVAVMATPLVPFAWRSAAILKRYPAPKHNIVTDEFLEELQREKDERRRQRRG